MTEREIQSQYEALSAVTCSRDEKDRQLRELGEEARRANLNWWASLIEARIAFRAKEYARAVELASTLLEAQDFSPLGKEWARFIRGIAYHKSNQAAKAITDLTATVNTPTASTLQRISAIFNRGLVYEHKNQIAEAVADFTAIIDAPDASAKQVARARVSRGTAYHHGNQLEKAITDYTEVIDSPDSPTDQRALAQVNRGCVYGQRGEAERAIADCTAVIETPDVPSETKAHAWVNRGTAYAQSGRTKDAIDDFTAAIRTLDTFGDWKSRARLGRGFAYHEAHQIENAIADFTAVIDAAETPSSQRAAARIGRGVAYAGSGQTEKAIADYAAVIDGSDTTPDEKARARISRGLAYRAGGQTPEALEDYTAVIDDPIAPPEHKSHARVNRSIIQHQDRRFEEAIADADVVIEACDAPAEQKARAYINRAFVYRDSGHADKEINDYTAVIDLVDVPAKQRVGARINRGCAYGGSGLRDSAIADFTHAIQDVGVSAEQRVLARFNRALTYRDGGRRAEALDDCDVITADPAAPAAVKWDAEMLKRFLLSFTPAASTRVFAQLPVQIDADTRARFRDALEKGRATKEYFFETESLFRSDASFLLVLREWNSYTPAIPDEGEPSRGGGYFIRHAGTGIVVDPGFDFLEIYHEAGGRLCDIDHIVITHAHNDHTAELEAILTLLYEFNDKREAEGKPKKSVNICLSQGAARKFAGLLRLRNCPEVREVVTLNLASKDHPQVVHLSDNIALTVLDAYHDDVVTADYAVGLGFEFTFPDGGRRKILFTGDTAVLPRDDARGQLPITEAYPESFGAPGMADLVVAHIGSIELDELEQPLMRFGSEEVYPALSSKAKPPNHLHLLGTFFVLHQLRPKAAIVSEFGEEMKVIWIKAIDAIGRILGDVLQAAGLPAVPVFAGNPFLIYNIADRTFLSHESRRFEPSDSLRSVEYLDPRPLRGVRLRRPYLFSKNSPHAQSEADRELLLEQFHEALQKRTLPHFRDSNPPGDS